MLTHCVCQLADFYLRSDRLITDTSFISEPANFFDALKHFFSRLAFSMNPFSNLLDFLEKVPLEIHWKNIIPMAEGSAS